MQAAYEFNSEQINGKILIETLQKLIAVGNKVLTFPAKYLDPLCKIVKIHKTLITQLKTEMTKRGKTIHVNLYRKMTYSLSFIYNM